jgi:hypothetical protein
MTYNLLTKTLCASLLLAACADDVEPLPEARFAQLSVDQRRTAISAALGFPVLYAELVANAVAAESTGPGSCPSRIVEGDTTIFNADVGCTDPTSGQRYTGRLHVTGSFDGAYELVFEHFSAGESLSFDGTISRGAPEADGRSRLLETVLFQLDEPVRVSMLSFCDADGVCATDDSARAALPGVGQYDVAFQRKLEDGDFSGWVELRGADVLRIDMTRDRDSSGCYPYSIDGVAAGSWCGVAR